MAESLKRDTGASGWKIWSKPSRGPSMMARLAVIRSFVQSLQSRKPEHGTYAHGVINGIIFAIGIIEGRQVVLGGKSWKARLCMERFTWMLTGALLTIWLAFWMVCAWRAA